MFFRLSLCVICFLYFFFVKLDATEDIWEKVVLYENIVNEDDPLIVQNRIISPSIKEVKRQMSVSCGGASKHIESYYATHPLPESVLDLGCGIGANSTPFAKKNIFIRAIDVSKDAIDVFNNTLARENIPAERLNLICDDIMTCEFCDKGEEFDAIFCIDVLPYVRASQLKNVLDKIHKALKPKGKLFCTFFFEPWPKTPLVELIEKLGGHFYPGREFIKRILIQSGFKIIECQDRQDMPNHPCVCISLLLEKT